MSNCLGSFKKWYIGSFIRAMLLDDQDVVALWGDKIFPLVAPENTEGDFLLYARAHYSRETVKMGVYEDDCQVELTIVSDVYDRALDIVATVDDTLVGTHEVEGFRFYVELIDSSEDFIDNKYVEKIIYRIK